MEDRGFLATLNKTLHDLTILESKLRNGEYVGTATAIKLIRRDIAEQLGLEFVHLSNPDW